MNITKKHIHITRSVAGMLVLGLVFYGLAWFSDKVLAVDLPEANHPMMFGYYHVAAQYGNFVNEVKDYTNTQIILQNSFLREDGTNDLTGFNNAFTQTIAAGQKIIFAPSITPANLLDRGLEAARPYWSNIDLIYLIDEPDWDQATTENSITSFKNSVAAKGLGQKEIAINYTNQQIMAGNSYQAANLDVVGFEAYMDVAQQNSSSLVANLESQIDQAKAKIGNKKMFIVIQGYNRNGTWTNLNSLQSIQTPPYLKAYNDPNVIGLFVFTYARPGGTKDLGSCIATEHKRIWGAISGAAQPASVSCGTSPTEVTATSFDATTGWGGSLAYNSINNNWLVVSSLGGTFGRIMNNDGTASGPEFTIASGASGGPKIAFAPDINKYLVVWLSWDDADATTLSEMKGRFINPDGSFSGSEFLVRRDNYQVEASMFASHAALNYDSRNRRFILVYGYVDRVRGAAGTHLITIGQTGTPIQEIVAIPVADGGGDASIVVNEDLNEYCMVYDRRSDPQPKVATRKINASNLSVGPEKTLATIGQWSNIVYNTNTRQYLIGWGNYSGQTLGRILKTCNITDVSGNTFTLNAAGEGSSIAYNPRSNRYAVIVQDSADYGNKFNILSSTGSLVSTGIAFAGSRTGSGGNFGPFIMANTNDGTFAATSAIDYNPTRFAPNLGTKSLPTITPIYLDLGDGAFPDVIWYQNRLWVAYRGPNSVSINLVSFNSRLQDQKSEKTIVLSAGAGGFPRLAASNGTLWMAWRDGEASGEDIKLWRQDTDRIQSLGPGAGNNPVALGNGNIYWQKNSNNTYPIYKRTLTGGNSVFVRNGEPTGIARVLANGTVQLISQDVNAVTWGVQAWYAGNLTVASDVTPNDDNGIVGRLENNPATEFNLWLGQRAHTPHAATDGNGNYAVATWNPTVRIAVFSVGSGPSNQTPIGAFDAATCDQIAGWAVDPDAPSQVVIVQIYVDDPFGSGTRVFSGTTKILRPDVNSALGIAGNHGFIVQTPDLIKDGNKHEVWIYAQDSVTHQNTSFTNNYKIFDSKSCNVAPPPPPPNENPDIICDPLPDDANWILQCNMQDLLNSKIQPVEPSPEPPPLPSPPPPAVICDPLPDDVNLILQCNLLDLFNPSY